MADEQCSERQTKILLFLSNNQVFVWDSEAVLTLRRKYRIVGSLVGSLPSNLRQNLVHSLPLVLQVEEVTLLLEKNVAKLVVNESAHSTPNQDTVKRFQEERKANVEEQIEKLKEIKVKKLEEFSEVIEEARGKKREKTHNNKRKISPHSEDYAGKKQRYTEENEEEQQTENDGVCKKTVCSESSAPNICNKTTNQDTCSLSTTNQDTSSLSTTNQDTSSLSTTNQDTCSLSTTNRDTSSLSTTNQDTWLLSTTNQDNLQDSTLVCVPSQHLPSLLETVDAKWTFPETELEKLHYKVFLDLWEKGYYITQGSKFGGDYLVYPGDPFRFHSYFVVTVVPWKKSIPSLDLVSISRLGSTVKKTSVLVSIDCSGNIIYTSIQWPGFT